MAQKNFELTFTTGSSPEEVYRAIGNVKGWWTRNSEGRTVAVGDEFTIRFGELWKTMRVITAVPFRTIAWEVVDCHLPFVKDVKEWKGTTIRFAIGTSRSGTQVRLTHIGLTPRLECYGACEEGWAHYFGEALPMALERSTDPRRMIHNDH